MSDTSNPPQQGRESEPISEPLLCSRCGLEKPLSEWEWHPSRNAWSWFCRECMRAAGRGSYIRNKANYQAAQKKYHKSEAGKKTAAKFSMTYRTKYPEKWTAHQKLRYAVSRGRIDKKPCEVCAEIKVEAHHYLGYEPEHWYDVQWLCRPHHRDAHKFSLRSRGILA